MNHKIIKNFSFVFGAQTLILVISVIRALILPKFLSIEDFGYWEVYWFYSTYVGLFCLGYADGIYLKYGEYDYNQLPIKHIRSGNLLFIGMLTFFTIICCLLIVLFVNDQNIAFGLVFSALNIVILGTTSVYIFIYQITNLFKKYSFYSVLDKVVLFVSILILLGVNLWDFKLLIIIDFLAKVLVLALMIIKSRELLFGERYNIRNSRPDLTDNIRVGIKLMIANLMSMLLIGAGKIIVQIFGDITEFAIYSFGISITGLVLTTVVSISLVLYPAVKRIAQERYSELFCQINSFNRLFGLSALLLYFPVYYFINLFYSQYNSVLIYLNLLFVLIFLQCKISILNNTFYKALREEKELLRANLLCVVLFILIALPSFYINHAMWVIAACTTIAMFYRCYSSEYFFCKKMSISLSHDDLYEILFLTGFVVLTTFLHFNTSMLLVALGYLVWFAISYRSNKELMVKLFKTPPYTT